jgi:hypothetical protein
MRELCPKSALLAAFGLALLAAGCGTVPQTPAGASPVAHFLVINVSDCEWQIAIAPAGGGETRALHLAARASQAIDLPGGDYVIEQTALLADAGIDSARRFTSHLDAGQTYRWRLATLLTAASGETGRDTTHDGPERKQ